MKKKINYTKLIISVCLLNGFAWVWCSYYLAYAGRTEIAQELSIVALTEIIASIFTYCAKSVLENLSKNNNWPDRKDK